MLFYSNIIFEPSLICTRKDVRQEESQSDIIMFDVRLR